MERPKHRWLILAGLAVLACGVVLLGYQLTSTRSGPMPGSAKSVSLHPAETHSDQTQAATVEAAAPVAPAQAGAAPTGTFRGRVIDAATRQPIPEFEVQLAQGRDPDGRFGGDPRAAQSFQSADGRFTWRSAPVGNWLVKVTAPRHQQFRVVGLRITAGKTTRELVMPLQRGYTLRGRVFDQTSKAGIAEAFVSFNDPSDWRGQVQDEQRYTKSKQDGTFVLDGVPRGDMIVRAGAKDYAYREVAVTVADETPPIEIGLATGGKISGMVVAPDGTPVKGMVMLGGPGVGSFAQTDETGSFSFPQQPAGRYELHATTASGGAKQQIELGENEVREDILLQVAQGRSVRGMIKGLRPEQLTQTIISLHSESRSAFFTARADEQGAYAFSGVPPMRGTLTALVPMSRRTTRTVEVPADKDVVLDIFFPPGARVSGIVSQGGKPARTMVSMGLDNPKADTLYHANTAEDGRYEIEAVPPGEYRIRAEGDVSRVVNVAGDTVLNIDIPLVQIAGRVLEDGAGAVPVVGADVFVRGMDAATDRVHAFRQTNHFGNFSMTGLQPGDVLLTVYKPGYEMYRERITYDTPIADKKITLRQGGGGVEIRVQSSSNVESLHGFMMTEKMRGDAWDVDLWIPLDREGIGHLPSALIGSTLEIQGSGDKPIVIREWDGQPLDLKL